MCEVFGFLFASFSLLFLLLQMKLVSRPVLKSRFFFFSALEYRAGGMDEAIIFIAITISHLLLPASYHRPITAATSYGPFPFFFKPKTAPLTISNRLYHPPFLPPPFFSSPAIV